MNILQYSIFVFQWNWLIFPIHFLHYLLDFSQSSRRTIVIRNANVAPGGWFHSLGIRKNHRSRGFLDYFFKNKTKVVATHIHSGFGINISIKPNQIGGILTQARDDFLGIIQQGENHNNCQNKQQALDIARMTINIYFHGITPIIIILVALVKSSVAFGRCWALFLKVFNLLPILINQHSKQAKPDDVARNSRNLGRYLITTR